MLSPARFKQWMYRGNRPHRLARIANRLYAWVGSLGITPNYMETLEVIGRKSGKIVSFPVVITVIDGATRRRFEVHGGFADVTPEGLTILAEQAQELASA